MNRISPPLCARAVHVQQARIQSIRHAAAWAARCRLLRLLMAPAPVPTAEMDQLLRYGHATSPLCNSSGGKSSLPTCSTHAERHHILGTMNIDQLVRKGRATFPLYSCTVGGASLPTCDIHSNDCLIQAPSSARALWTAISAHAWTETPAAQCNQVPDLIAREAATWASCALATG